MTQLLLLRGDLIQNRRVSFKDWSATAKSVLLGSLIRKIALKYISFYSLMSGSSLHLYSEMQQQKMYSQQITIRIINTSKDNDNKIY